MIVAVTGHRPHKLGGFNPNNPLRTALKATMQEKLLGLMATGGITGMALGIDQDFIEVCQHLDILYIAAIPFVGQESVWPSAAQEHYRHLLSMAHEVVYVDKLSEGPAGYAARKMQTRNQWMVDNSNHLLAVYDGSHGGTQNCVRYAEKMKKPITIINPRDPEFQKYWSA